MARNGRLTTNQTRAIAALLSERNVRAAAKSANVGERTLWKWLDLDYFRAELTRQEGAIIDQATRGLLSMQGAAIAAFDKVLKDESTTAASEANKLRAAEGVLDYLLKLRELNNLETRIRKLEEAQNEGLQ